MDREVVLVTGFPSLGPRRMVEHLLAVEPETRIVLVVLERRLAAAAEIVESYGAERARIEVLEGDAAALDLGLSGAEYRSVADRVTRVHHMASVSFVGVDRQTAEQTNVGGAVEMIELGRAAPNLRCIVHHSTAQVSGDRAGTVYEDELDRGQSFHGVVQETRFRAEMAIRRAMDELPIAVVRPTTLVGDSITGDLERLAGPYLLVTLALGLPGSMRLPRPSTDHPLDIVPIDYVVRAAHHIGRHPEAPGRTFHLSSGETLTTGKVFDLIAQAGGRRTTARRYLPTQAASVIMKNPVLQRLMREPGAFLQQIATPARYDDRNARRLLADTGIVCPPLESYVGTWVSAVQDHMRARGAG